MGGAVFGVADDPGGERVFVAVAPEAVVGAVVVVAADLGELLGGQGARGLVKEFCDAGEPGGAAAAGFVLKLACQRVVQIVVGVGGGALVDDFVAVAAIQADFCDEQFVRIRNHEEIGVGGCEQAVGLREECVDAGKAAQDVRHDAVFAGLALA